jgi:hypothetical protein
MTNDGPHPSSDGALDWQNRNRQTVPNIWSWAPDGARHQDRLIVGRNVTQTETDSLSLSWFSLLSR